MKKETIYLSLPDYFNKFMLCNYNEKISYTDSLSLSFKLNTKNHFGSALKAIYLLEIIFPRKPNAIKLIIKKKKVFFGQKSNSQIFFNFDITISSIEFFSFFRFFCKNPLKKSKINELPLVNRKLKQFEFNKFISIVPINIKSSFHFIKLYHLN